MFIYFDLGNVIAFFDRRKSCQQMAALAGIDPAQVEELVFNGPLNNRYERGDISTPEFYDAFCSATGSKPDLDALMYAKADIFRLNYSLLPVIAQLEDAGVRLGILSNTSPCHWEFLSTRGYGILPHAFAVRALSYEVGALKPEPKMYHAAAELAGVAPNEIFFCDDTLGHVAAAREAGFDAVQYTSTPKLVAELRDGQFVGEMSFFTGQLTTADVIASSALRYLYWRADRLSDLFDHQPALMGAFHAQLSSDLARKLAGVNRK